MVNRLSDLIIGHYERHAAAWDADRANSAWNDKPSDNLGTIALWQCCPKARASSISAAVPVRRSRVTWLRKGSRSRASISSPTFISLCRSRLPDHEWIVGDMRRLSLGRSFQGILAWDSFFHLNHDDQRNMFDIFARHAGPSAVLMFNAGPSHGEAIGSYRGDPLYHASLGPAEYAELLAGIGFEIVAHVAEDAQAGGRTAWLATCAELTRRGHGLYSRPSTQDHGDTRWATVRSSCEMPPRMNWSPQIRQPVRSR